MKALSLPHEHGGYLTLAASVVAGVLAAPRHLPGLAVGLALAAAFFARGPLERDAERRARFDGALLGALAVVVTLGAWIASWTSATAALLAAGLPLMVVASSLYARRRRLHRHPLFELGGMGFLGGCAGLLALVGGAPPAIAATVAVVCGVNAVVAVPLVRTELRRNERAASGRAEIVAVAALLVGALAVVALGVGGAALAFAPRLVTLAQRRLAPIALRPSQVGLRETATLAAAVALLLLRG